MYESTKEIIAMSVEERLVRSLRFEKIAEMMEVFVPGLPPEAYTYSELIDEAIAALEREKERIKTP
jgi:hypothetical protein